MAWRAALAVFVVLSGCLENDGPTGPREDEQPIEFLCPTSAKILDSGACVTLLEGGGGTNLEASLAASPKANGTALVAWQEIPASGLRERFIWMAMTTDGGESWTKTKASPRLPAPLGQTEYIFDPIAAFSPSGTAMVLFGETMAVEPLPGTGLPTTVEYTLAKSRDAGRTWEYLRFGPSVALALQPDFMSLAVAPDTGHLFVAADQATQAGFRPTVVWRSTDEGVTWDAPVLLNSADQVEVAHQFPRAAAGRDGQIAVVVTTTGQLGTGVTAFTSTDDGRTFEASSIADESFQQSNGPPIFDGTNITAVLLDGPPPPSSEHGAGIHIARRTSATWTVPEPFTDVGWNVRWAIPALGPLGLVVLARSDQACTTGAGYEVSLLRTEGPLVLGSATNPPTMCEGGDDYGGLALEGDLVWAAWAQPTGDGTKVAVARLKL